MVDVAVVCFDDCFADCESESESFEWSRGYANSGEWFEYFCGLGLRDTDSVIDYLKYQ